MDSLAYEITYDDEVFEGGHVVGIKPCSEIATPDALDNTVGLLKGWGYKNITVSPVINLCGDYHKLGTLEGLV